MSPPPDWRIVGDWFDNCSCAVACPCTFGQAPDNNLCETVLFWHIREGHYVDVELNDLCFVRVGSFDGSLWAGEARGRYGTFVDDRASDAQADALLEIYGGQAGGFPEIISALYSRGREVFGIERATISFEIAPNQSRWGLDIPGKVKAWPGPRLCPGRQATPANPRG